LIAVEPTHWNTSDDLIGGIDGVLAAIGDQLQAGQHNRSDKKKYRKPS